MPALGEIEESEGRSETSNGGTGEAERLKEAVDGNATPPVEGAHSDEVRSVRSESDEGSRGGSRRLPPLLGDFDVLRFKNTMLEVVEELRMRRIIDAENEERIKSLITEKQDLEQKLEEEHANYEAVIEGHTHSEQELKRSYEEQLKQAEEEVTRSKLSAESKEQEAKALKDEIRSLHLTRYNLEKKVQEQERQLHLQGSSKENYLSQVNQLEQNCLSVSRQTSEVTEQMERLEANAKQVTELHKKLVYVNEHQKCELRQSHEQLEQCRRELLEARVTVNAERERIQTVGDSVKTKANSHELRMQVELNHQLQEQLSALREEHQSIIQQLKEAHSLVERHIDNSAKLSATEVVLEEEVKVLRETTEDLQQKLATLTQVHEFAVESHSKEKADSNEKCFDLDQRLKTLQADYTALQASHDRLDEEKLASEKKLQIMKEDLKKLKDELKKAEDEFCRLNEDKESLSEKAQRLQLELDGHVTCQESMSAVTIEKSECENAEQKRVIHPQSLVLSSLLSSKALKVEESEDTSIEISTATSVVPHPPSLSPVFSPEVILISPPSNFTASKPTPPDSPPQGHAKDSEDMTVTTSDTTHHQSVLQEVTKATQPNELSVAIVSSSSANKRTANHDSDEECTELLSPGKRVRLDQDAKNCYSNQVTKVADSPHDEESVKDEPVGDKDTDHVSEDIQAVESVELLKQEGTKPEQPCTENEHVICASEDNSLDNESNQIQSLEKSSNFENKNMSDSEEIASLSSSGVGEQPNIREKAEEMQVMFSDDEDYGGVSGSQMDEARMFNSQMNKQIDRVQMFLKLERLRRPKK